MVRLSDLHIRDGPKFGRRRSSAEEFGRMFGSATCDYSAELRQTFGVIFGFAFAAFCARRRSPLALTKINILTISY